MWKERNVFEMLCWVAILQKSAVRLMAKNVLNSISSFLRLLSLFTIQFSVFCMYISGLIFLLSWLFLSNINCFFFYLLFLFSVLLCVVSDITMSLLLVCLLYFTYYVLSFRISFILFLLCCMCALHTRSWFFYSLFLFIASSFSFSFLVFVCFVSLLIQC
jgi:hypothetical protein